MKIKPTLPKKLNKCLTFFLYMGLTLKIMPKHFLLFLPPPFFCISKINAIIKM